MSGSHESPMYEDVPIANPIISTEKKKCSRCKKNKNINLFSLDNSRKSKLSPICNQCNSERSKIWRNVNKNYCQKKFKKYYVKNKKKIKLRSRKYALLNQDKVKQYLKTMYEKNKKNPMKKLNRNISSGVWLSLNDKGIKKNRHWETLVGYTVDQLKNHLEKQFKDGMTWENYGKWHIDHIIPKVAFNYSSPEDIDFKKCWALKNLQPMWALENISKGTKLLKPFQPSLALG